MGEGKYWGSGEPPSESDIEARLREAREAFELAGGTVQHFDAAPKDGKKRGQRAFKSPKKASKLSGYERERCSKAESLSTRLNLRSVDHQNVPSGGGTARLEVGEIAAALAMGSKRKGGLTGPQQNLVIYYYTADPSCRSSAWAYLMIHLADVVLREKWGTRKRGILQNMANTALDELLCPPQYRAMSDRAWAGKLGLGNHSQWRAYRPRYRALVDHAKDVINRADQMLSDQL